MMEWYYVHDNVQGGPVNQEELFRMARDGRLLPNDLVWNSTMGDQWQPGYNIVGLFEPGTETGRGKEETIPRFLPQYPEDASCTAVIRPTWERMKRILFRPFEIGKWFTLGFSAWLAALFTNQTGGGGQSFQLPGQFSPGPGPGGQDPFANAEKWISEHVGLVVAIAVAAILVWISITVLACWLRSRGHFMLLDNVVHNRARIAEPWRAFKRLGNSLFGWYIVYWLAAGAVFLILGGMMVLSFIPMTQGTEPSPLAIVILCVMFPLIFCVAVFVSLIEASLQGFVVPIMYRFDLAVMDAWRAFLRLAKPHAWKFIVFFIMQALLGFCAGIGILLVQMVTCGLAGILLAIPYIGAVAALPITVFFRAYSLEYLAQYGREYDLFSPSPEQPEEAPARPAAA